MMNYRKSWETFRLAMVGAFVISAGLFIVQLSAAESGRSDDFGERVYLAEAPTVYADSSAEYFAKEISYYKWVVGKKINCTRDGFFVSVKEYDYSEKDGFYAVAFASQKTGDIILAFRGTDNIASTIQDLDPIGIGYAAYKAHISEVSVWVSDQLKEKPDRKFLLTGHSLGGALAQWFTVGLTAQNIRVDKLETFNSPGISADFINTYFKKEYCPTVIHYIQSGDVVSMAGRAYVPGTNYIYYYPFGVSFVTKHDVPMTVPRIAGLDKPYGTSRVTIQTGYLNAYGFLYTRRADEGYFDFNYHSKIFIVSRIFSFLDALYLRGTTEDTRADIGPLIQWILNFYKKYSSGNSDNSIEMNVQRVDENTIVLDLSTLKAQQLEVYCCLPNEDAFSELDPEVLESVNTQQIALSDNGHNSLTFNKLKPSTDYVIIACSYENEGEITELSNYAFILASTREVQKVVSVQAKMVTDESIVIGWDNLLQLGDALYGGVQYRKKGESSWSLPQEAIEPSVNYQLITGLSAANTYEIRVVFYSREGFVRSQSEVIQVETHSNPVISYQLEEGELVIHFEGTLYESQDAITWSPIVFPPEQEGIYRVPLSENKQMYYAVRYEF